MNRASVAALVLAGVVGVAGGTLSAVVRGDAPADRPPPAPAASGTTPGPRSTALLYADGRVIHDGDRSVRYDAPEGTPARLLRTDTGYLVANATSPQEPSFRLYAVARDGATTTLADVLGSWDLDATRTKVAGTDLDSGGLFVWDLTGRVLATSGRPMEAYLDPVWRGDTVALSGRTEQRGQVLWRVWSWTPATRAMVLTDQVGMTGWTGSADGARVAGSVAADGASTDRANPCLRVLAGPGTGGGREWQSCDWRLNGPTATAVFSPDGRRLVAIDTRSDGFGPGSFAVVSATAGPASGVRQVDAPDWTLDAQWVDDDHLVVRSRTDDSEDAGTVLTRCDLAGSCREVARRASGELVVGEPY